MSADERLDQHLREVFSALVTATSMTKQMVWSASSVDRDRLRELQAFLVAQSRLVDEAEARLGGRAEEMSTPSSHVRPNLLGEVGNDMEAALATYVQRVRALAADIDKRASDIGDADEARVLTELSEGLQTRLADLAGEA